MQLNSLDPINLKILILKIQHGGGHHSEKVEILPLWLIVIILHFWYYLIKPHKYDKTKLESISFNYISREA